ncbi:Hypothetical predicted protein [Paramuricea clavata]|uniref:Uncharacterized protein n=1 Tax=Paramuricea clavata TaxID=317549 RepID=A0A6S7HB49_PARCT|nr:Hypothetical predicted protein [Paramuricea clavata]
MARHPESSSKMRLIWVQREKSFQIQFWISREKMSILNLLLKPVTLVLILVNHCTCDDDDDEDDDDASCFC